MPLIRLRFKPPPGMAGLICSSARMASDRFPANDQRILAGKERIPEEPLADLTSGVLDVAWMRLMNELTQALIQYTRIFRRRQHRGQRPRTPRSHICGATSDRGAGRFPGNYRQT